MVSLAEEICSLCAIFAKKLNICKREAYIFRTGSNLRLGPCANVVVMR